MTEKTQYLAEKVAEMEERGETWDLRTLQTPSKPNVKVEGKEAILLAANNYLDLANDPRVKAAAQDAIDEFGMGAGSDWSIAGYMEVQEELNQAIADFKDTEAGVSLQTGFSVNAGVLPQLLEDGDVYLSDKLNHGSIIDGVRLSPAD
ncbi:MAG: aminotransferase class I/II-fold pyridoxal phosphate-dependent enzyme, partial [Halodesulfurarchaeum sp.]|nr:aminotransferase class I/II-fold pyridoxal phosphate-dependent enzyme [Halodesulfurarchaeum sp.]